MPKKSFEKTKPKTKSVRFALVGPRFQAVSLAGDFNGWDVNSLPMKKDKKGTWKLSLGLSPGRFEYRFFADGTWQDDPNAQDKVSNPFGSHNSIRIVN